MNDTLTSVEGIAVGHWTHLAARTGCTVVLCPPEGCVISGLALGSAPGSREYALLAPEKSVNVAHAVLLAGGSAFGLDAATGVMQWLELQGRGFATPFARVPIVPAAVIYDFLVGDAKLRPSAQAGFQATASASFSPVETGQVGVGTGAMVGKYLGFEHASKGALGSASMQLGEVTVAALAVTNAVGDIVYKGQFIAGAKVAPELRENFDPSRLIAVPGANTTLVVVATDAQITKAEARALAQSAHIGIAHVTSPSHTMHDGDTSFVLSTCQKPAVSMMALSIAVQQVVAKAIVQGVQAVN